MNNGTFIKRCVYFGIYRFDRKNTHLVMSCKFLICAKIVDRVRINNGKTHVFDQINPLLMECTHFDASTYVSHCSNQWSCLLLEMERPHDTILQYILKTFFVSADIKENNIDKIKRKKWSGVTERYNLSTNLCADWTDFDFYVI